MYQIEYNKVREIVKLDKSFNNISIKFGETYYAIVRGNIPLEVANIIYEKYPGNPYGIRINGGCDDWNPNKVHPHYYHIDSKEGLIVFITEMKDYYARQNGLPETEVQKYNKYLALVNEEILKK